MITRAMFSNIAAFTPEAMERLRDTIGLTAIIPDEYLTHHSGFNLPDELTMYGPISGWRERTDKVINHRKANKLADNAWPVFPGIAGRTDDSNLLRVIEKADHLGLEVWAHMGLWGYSGDIYPEYAFKDVFGNDIDEQHLLWGIPLCPSNEKIRNWTADCIKYAVRNYGVKGIDLDHGHFPPLVNIDGIFGCACPNCVNKAIEIGYNFNNMVSSIKEIKEKLENLDVKKFKTSIENAGDFIEFLINVAGNDKEIHNWFDFRADIVTGHMRFLTDEVKAISGGCPVDSHLMPPSIAYESGQDIKKWETAINRLTPGWGPVVGWDWAVANTFAGLARYFSTKINGLDMGYVLNAVYKLFGYEKIDMPYSISQLFNNEINNADFFLHETEEAVAELSSDTQFLPPLRINSFLKQDIEKHMQIVDLAKGSFIYGGATDQKTLDVVASIL